jgi:hypothetical protein
MEAYHFTEFPWPHLPPEDQYSSMRVNLPSRVYDPKIGADLYHRYLEQWSYGTPPLFWIEFDCRKGQDAHVLTVQAPRRSSP